MIDFQPYKAEKQGFEPWIRLPVCRISSAVRSTTPASLLLRCKINANSGNCKI